MNRTNVVVRNVGNVCRLCLSTKEPKSSVFAAEASGSISLAEKIQTCLSIEIQTSDRLSTLICADCLRRVDKWHSYKEHCLRSQKKLEQCLGECTDGTTTIKVEPEDAYEAASPLDTVPLSSDEEDDAAAETPAVASFPIVSPGGNSEETPTDLTLGASTIKQELREENGAEVESVGSTELLLNPMAVSGHRDERTTEVNTVGKLSKPASSKPGTKKKVRRGPQTHFRGSRRYKKKCSHCQIYLHSKWSYAKHTERFHSGEVRQRTVKPAVTSEIEALNNAEPERNISEARATQRRENEEEDAGRVTAELVDTEMVEDVEDELISLEKDAPLTPVQQNIISQLKTFSCYTCRLCFQDRRSTLNHIRQHMPDLRPYTCIACLTEFADRSIYKLHCGASFQCAMKIALVVPEHGTEKYFTCNMCLRSLANRKELLVHLSRHSDRQYEQLMGAPFRSPPRLKPVAPLSSSSPSAKRKPNAVGTGVTGEASIENYGLPDPYKNGDPAHNHTCIYCGMIYRYKLNLLKHVSLCKKLPAETRICYRCVNCGKSFLAFNKFHNHVHQEHRKKDLVCHRCNAKFKPADFLAHYREHYTNEADDSLVSQRSFDGQGSCKIERCGSDVNRDRRPDCTNGATRTPKNTYTSKSSRLLEYRKMQASMLHSCTICRCQFDRASILEAHMADHHEIGAESLDATVPGYEAARAGNHSPLDKSRFSIKSDPGGSSTECHTCGKVFANYQNLRRHIRTVHDVVGRFSCFTCAKTFVHEEQWTEHVEKEHRRTADRVQNCPSCPETFESQQELILHRRDVHGLSGDDHLACYICGKIFASETSLKIHRGHHFRVNSRLSIGNTPETERNEDNDRKPRITLQHEQRQVPVSPSKSPRAKKSFPSPSPAGQTQQSSLQCQVCDDRFNDVSELRKHLWDVHCARNKPERFFMSDALQCQLCTNVLPDEESLKSHLKWHGSNPILGNNRRNAKPEEPAQCDLCGKFYSSAGNLRKHKKRHKAASFLVNGVRSSIANKKSCFGNGFACPVCRKVFAERSTMMKHRVVAHPAINRRNENPPSAPTRTIDKPDLVKPVRPKLDFDALTNPETSTALSEPAKKSLVCNLCRKAVTDLRALYKHRRLVHKIINDVPGPNVEFQSSSATNSKQVSCTACTKLFSSAANMRQHFTKVHNANATTSGSNNRSAQLRCSVGTCKLSFKTLIAKQNHEKTHANVIYTCALCPRYLLSPSAMAEHMLNAHKTNGPTGYDRNPMCKKIDLDKYVVKGANGRECPVCKINYPNNKALKVHYLKIHEATA